MSQTDAEEGSVSIIGELLRCTLKYMRSGGLIYGTLYLSHIRRGDYFENSEAIIINMAYMTYLDK